MDASPQSVVLVDSLLQVRIMWVSCNEMEVYFVHVPSSGFVAYSYHKRA